MLRLPTDDSLFAVDSRFLGPRGWALPWQARYAAYGVGFAVCVVVLAVERRAGIGLGFTSAAWTLLITVAITSAIMRRVTPERPVRTLAVTFWHELTAPRPPRPQTVVFRPARLVKQR